MSFDFVEYGRTLEALGYRPLNDEADFRWLFAVFIGELRTLFVDRVRRRFVGQWDEGADLIEYVSLRRLDFVAFDPSWTIEVEMLDREFVAAHATAAADAVLGLDDPTKSLPDYCKVTSDNRKLIGGHYSRLAVSCERGAASIESRDQR
jgi:hypothetical protein